jgi:hypothetical protein
MQDPTVFETGGTGIAAGFLILHCPADRVIFLFYSKSRD